MCECKKVGIMTFFETRSQGALLQAFALQRTIQNQGYACEIINYDRFFQRNKNIVSCSNFSGKIKASIITFYLKADRFLHSRRYNEQKKSISEFQKTYLKVGAIRYSTIEELEVNPPIYDAYVVGSDQVWNPDTINQKAFYFTFLDYTAKTISYAPSLGVGNIHNEFVIKKMKDYLEHVKFLSCREEDGKRFLEKITGRKVAYVLDPTMLFKKEEWIQMLRLKKQKKKRKYILCYFLGSLSYGRNAAKKYADTFDLDIIFIVQNPREMISRGKKIYNIDPEKFLTLILNAEVIFTDSFHGTVFSVIFNKEFYSFCRRNPSGQSSRISRIENILEKLQLKERLILPGKNVLNENRHIDYRKVNQNVEMFREVSLKYLLNALREI